MKTIQQTFPQKRSFKKFLRFFKKGFKDQKYLDWEEIINGMHIWRGKRN
jgi:hypothetical protein